MDGMRLAVLAVIVMAAAVASGCKHFSKKDPLEIQNDWLQQNEKRRAEATDAPEPDILPTTYFAAGQLLEQQGQFGLAVAQYQSAIQSNPEFTEAYNRLGTCLIRLGRYQEAERHLQRAVTLDPQQAHLHNNLGFCCMLQKDWPNAERELSTALQIRPEYPRAGVNLGITLAKQGREGPAFAQFSRILGDALAYYNLGLVYRSDGNYPRAIESFQKALALEPRLVQAKKELTATCRRQGLKPPHEAAVTEISSAPAFQPTLAGASVSARVSPPFQPADDRTANVLAQTYGIPVSALKSASTAAPPALNRGDSGTLDFTPGPPANQALTRSGPMPQEGRTRNQVSAAIRSPDNHMESFVLESRSDAGTATFNAPQSDPDATWSGLDGLVHDVVDAWQDGVTEVAAKPTSAWTDSLLQLHSDLATAWDAQRGSRDRTRKAD